MKKLFARTSAFVTAAFAMVLSGAAAAADWTSVTTGLDFSGEITAIQAVIGVIATVIIVMTGGAFLMQALKKK